MKYVNVLFVAFCLAVIFLPVASYAEDGGIAVIDIQKLLKESSAAKSLDEQISSKQSKYQSEISAKESTLLEDEKKLNAQKSEIAASDYTAKREAIEDRAVDLRQLAKRRKSVLDEALRQGLTTIKDEVLQITANLAEERSYSMVVTRQNVVLAAKELDITDEVMGKLNEKLPTVKVDMPKD